MEHQTCTSLYYGAYDEGIIAHELAHQWCGDLITCADFHAHLAERGLRHLVRGYWREAHDGMAAYHAEMAGARYLGRGHDLRRGSDRLQRASSTTTSPTRRPAGCVHMLRHVLGDADFFAGLRPTAPQYGYGSATTEQFRRRDGSGIGQDLRRVLPAVDLRRSTTRATITPGQSEPAGAGWRVRLRIEQSQIDTGLFTMPLDVMITTTESGRTRSSSRTRWPSSGTSFDVAAAPIGRGAGPGQLGAVHEAVPGHLRRARRRRPSARLLGAAPNPFNPRTTVRFSLPLDGGRPARPARRGRTAGGGAGRRPVRRPASTASPGTVATGRGGRRLGHLLRAAARRRRRRHHAADAGPLVAALLAASLLWAFSFGLIKGELAGLSPVAVAAGRLVDGGARLPAAGRPRRRGPRGRAWPRRRWAPSSSA